MDFNVVYSRLVEKRRCLWSTESSAVQTTSKVSDGVEIPGADLRMPVVEWKFAELDTNGDGRVDHKEMDRLGRLVKKLVKPASCAATFRRRCNVDLDSGLTLREWKSCFDDRDDDGVVETGSSAADGSCLSLIHI